jgi:serine/threonine protein kinase
MAPEINGDEPYTYSADVYSFGITIAATLTGYNSCTAIFPEELCKKLPQNTKHLELLQEIACRCARPQPEHRPAATKVRRWINLLLEQWDTVASSHESASWHWDSLSNCTHEGHEDGSILGVLFRCAVNEAPPTSCICDGTHPHAIPRPVLQANYASIFTEPMEAITTANTSQGEAVPQKSEILQSINEDIKKIYEQRYCIRSLDEDISKWLDPTAVAEIKSKLIRGDPYDPEGKFLRE